MCSPIIGWLSPQLAIIVGLLLSFVYTSQFVDYIHLGVSWSLSNVTASSLRSMIPWYSHLETGQSWQSYYSTTASIPNQGLIKAAKSWDKSPNTASELVVVSSPGEVWYFYFVPVLTSLSFWQHPVPSGAAREWSDNQAKTTWWSVSINGYLLMSLNLGIHSLPVSTWAIMLLVHTTFKVDDKHQPDPNLLSHFNFTINGFLSMLLCRWCCWIIIAKHEKHILDISNSQKPFLPPLFCQIDSFGKYCEQKQDKLLILYIEWLAENEKGPRGHCNTMLPSC